DAPRQQPIAEAMAAAIGGLRLIFARSVDHVERLCEQELYQHRRARGIVSVVAIDHYVDVRFDVREHSSDDVPLAAQMLRSAHGSGLARGFRGSIRRTVVVDEYQRVGQCRSEVGDDLTDRGFLVEARTNDGNLGRPAHLSVENNSRVKSRLSASATTPTIERRTILVTRRSLNRVWENHSGRGYCRILRWQATVSASGLPSFVMARHQPAWMCCDRNHAIIASRRLDFTSSNVRVSSDAGGSVRVPVNGHVHFHNIRRVAATLDAAASNFAALG